MDTDVLIVGAGPTGLMLANQLARRGVKPVIIDRHSGPAQQTRAMAVQARTMEIYAQMGLANEALALGQVTAAANMWANGQHSARIPIGDIGANLSPFPFVLMLGQDDNERIMGAKLRELGVPVAWNTELVGFEQKADHVAAQVRHPDGTMRTITAAWLAGCDGSRSPVRELSRIGFPGAPYAQTFFVADTEARGSMIPNELNVYLWRDGFHLFFSMRGTDRWRVIGILPEELRAREDVTFDDVIPSIKREAGTDLDFRSCGWFSVYRIHHRAAERFRDRRAFLLGDAAHIHSPAGAQGMNTGLQDAYNLGWKLALVVQGKAEGALLDSYEQERIPVAKRLLQTTDRAFQAVVSQGWLPTLIRTKVIARVAATAMKLERVRKLAFRTISQIGISYPDSALSQAMPGLPADAPKAGDRFPWLRLKLSENGPVEDLYRAVGDTHFNLLVFGQEASADSGTKGFGDLVRVHAIPGIAGNNEQLAGAGISQPSFYLLRPDGHVGICGPGFDSSAIRRYLVSRVRTDARAAMA
jgi:2-polyprenyl-6-methoxyphenol hydroxylase-like FAD-dependent oxidoreductase